ncbi:hypothetical protein LTR66_005984 [Elasticomyces elasticus]|nr:hypothetical protein LTR28_012335 [Elasticomyces elasticus]KAK4993556.1 hypothetical protein LTR66_005984 [Elasticomyces elasticus]
MINSSPVEHAFIRACIIFLHHIAPVSLVLCAAILTSALPARWRLPAALELYLEAEAAFYLFIFLPHKHYLQAKAVHPPLRPRHERRELFERANSNVVDPEKYLQGWFKGAPPNEIRRENVKLFLAWAFMDKETVDDVDEEELEEYMQGVEKVLGRALPSGKGTAVPLRVSLDPVDMLHRSLLWYACIGFVDTLTFLCLRLSGFHFHRLSLRRFWTLFPFRFTSLTSTRLTPAEHLTYWHRPHTSKTRRPVLFIHGIGIGLWPYMQFLRELNAYIDDGSPAEDGHVGILAVEIMPISCRLTSPLLSKNDFCAELLAILHQHPEYMSPAGFVLISHSYGSILTTHILSNPTLCPLVANVLLIDPVCVLLHLPDVAYNFLARQPTPGWLWTAKGKANEWQLWYFASKDPGVAHALSRRFFWSENCLWKNDIDDLLKDGKRVSVSLGSRDLIVDAESVGRYLVGSKPMATRQATCEKNSDKLAPVMDQQEWKTRPWKGDGLEVLWFDDLDHAQVFDKKATRARLLAVVKSYCKLV